MGIDDETRVPRVYLNKCSWEIVAHGVGPSVRPPFPPRARERESDCDANDLPIAFPKGAGMADGHDWAGARRKWASKEALGLGRREIGWKVVHGART